LSAEVDETNESVRSIELKSGFAELEDYTPLRNYRINNNFVPNANFTLDDSEQTQSGKIISYIKRLSTDTAVQKFLYRAGSKKLFFAFWCDQAITTFRILSNSFLNFGVQTDNSFYNHVFTIIPKTVGEQVTILTGSLTCVNKKVLNGKEYIRLICEIDFEKVKSENPSLNIDVDKDAEYNARLSIGHGENTDETANIFDIYVSDNYDALIYEKYKPTIKPTLPKDSLNLVNASAYCDFINFGVLNSMIVSFLSDLCAPLK